ncbi:MAG: hypothetical protein IJW17_02440 [Lentisphaeria bacterium]|nr:hypothetical protein [Lentisphaeria bacterium]
MKKRMGKNCRFTLIEIMITLGVVLILVSIGILVVPLVTRQFSEAKTKALMGMIETAIEQYKNSNISGGHYPISPLTTHGNDTQYTPFFMDNYDLKNNSENDNQNVKYNMVQFFEIEQVEGNLLYEPAAERFYITDGFGMPFLYMAPGYRSTGGYDLISLGANKMPGNNEGKDVKKDDGGIYKRILNGRLSVVNKKEAEYAAQLGSGDDIARK